MDSEMTEVLIEGRCIEEHVKHLKTSWVGIKDQNLVSHQVGLQYVLTCVTAEVSNVDSD